MLRLADRASEVRYRLPTRTEYLFMDRAYHSSMSRVYLAVPADSRMADALFREVPEDEEEDEEEQGDDEEEEEEEEDDEGEGYSE